VLKGDAILRRALIIRCLIVSVLCLCLIFAYFYSQKITLAEVLEQNGFDISKIEDFEIYQNSYNWYTRKSTTIELKDVQSVIEYLEHIDQIEMSAHEPVFFKPSPFFDYYNYIAMISVKCSYDNKYLSFQIYNLDFGLCNILLYINGVLIDYELYAKAFEAFLFDSN